MSNSLLTSILGKIGIAIVIVALADLVYINYLVLRSSKSEAESLNAQNSARQLDTLASPNPLASASPVPVNSANTQSTLATPTPTTIYQTQIEKQTVVQNAQKEIFVPVGSGASFSNSYAALSGVEVTIDWSKYTGIESVLFEATVRVDGGNGRAYAQLVNITDNNPLNESTITSSSGGGEFKISGKIPTVSGVKTYGVRAKTDIVEFAAHVDNAKIKITLK